MNPSPKASHRPRTGLGCPTTGKRMFATLEEAQGFLDRGGLRSIDGSGHVPVRAYVCVYCEGAHVTHSTRRPAA